MILVHLKIIHISFSTSLDNLNFIWCIK